jgi:hypothetical protein
MINWLIRLAAEKGAREIEKGSPVGAAIGAILGATAGVITPYLLYQAEIIERSWVEVAVTCGIGLALAGGFIGSLVRVNPRTVEPWNEKVTDAGTIRITNYNHALGPLLLLLLATGLLLFAAVSIALDLEKARQEWIEKFDLRLLLFPIFYVVLVGLAVRTIWWMEIGPEIRIKRLLGTKRLNAGLILNWHFVSNSGAASRQPPRVGPLQIVLTIDGDTFQLPVKTQVAARVADILNRHAARP